MMMLRAAASLAALVALGLAVPAAAQSSASGINQGGEVASGVRTVPSDRGPARLEPGNFPVPGLDPWTGRLEDRRFARPDRPDRPDRPRRRDRYASEGIGYSGFIDPDRGYFAGRGHPPEVIDGHVAYDYDRGYPYDHYEPARAPELGMAFHAEPRRRSCETEWTQGSGSDPVAVRVCRN